ncbi:HTH_Tnp_Tc3_2 domain-containing protein [Trichonephila clavipes]|nr:HTH_Tnp_Tc3_2 domain-containing protein [Trichonephila clavipes]
MRLLEDAGKNGLNNGRFQGHDGNGRPKTTADREDILIVRSGVTVLDSSLSTIRRVTRTRVSTKTIHRRLIERNLRTYRPLHHLPLTPAHYRAILNWCLTLSGWNHDYKGAYSVWRRIPLPIVS